MQGKEGTSGSYAHQIMPGNRLLSTSLDPSYKQEAITCQLFSKLGKDLWDFYTTRGSYVFVTNSSSKGIASAIPIDESR